MIQPVKIQIKEEKFLEITWNDDEISKIKLSNLRNNCPCAFCKVEREERSSSYIPLYSDEQLKIADMKIAGYYALSVAWKDGHNTGIYEFNQLRNLSSNEEK